MLLKKISGFGRVINGIIKYVKAKNRIKDKMLKVGRTANNKLVGFPPELFGDLWFISSALNLS